MKKPMFAFKVAGIASVLLLAASTGLAAPQPEAAGTVRLAVGETYATAADGTRRALKDDDIVYSGDTLSTGADSYIDLDLDDDGRVMLRPGTQFQIQSFHFDADAHPDNAPPKPAAVPENAFFRLIKGGLRVVSGLVGHTDHSQYRLETAVTTIGIRGTEYDVRYCTADCSDEADNGHAPADGLYTGVDRGAIALTNKGGETVTQQGQYSYVRSGDAAATLLSAPPAALRHMEVPEKYRKLEEERERRHRHDRDRDRDDRHRRHRHHGPGG